MKDLKKFKDIDILQVLITLGIEYNKKGYVTDTYYKNKNGTYLNKVPNTNILYDHYNKKSLDTIGIVQQHKNLDFKNACKYLEEEFKIKPKFKAYNVNNNQNKSKFIKRYKNSNKQPVQQKKGKFIQPDNININEDVKKYLVGERKIDEEIVNYYIERNTIYLTKYIGNNWCVFICTSSDKKAKGALLRYIGDRKTQNYKNVKNSLGKFGFNKQGKTKKLYVFESPIDMLSYESICKIKRKELNDHLLAMNGLSEKPIIEYVNNFDIKSIIVCTDNDNAKEKENGDLESVGNNFIFKVLEHKKLKDLEISRNIPKNKDFNEDLVKEVNLIEKEDITFSDESDYTAIEINKKLDDSDLISFMKNKNISQKTISKYIELGLICSIEESNDTIFAFIIKNLNSEVIDKYVIEAKEEIIKKNRGMFNIKGVQDNKRVFIFSSPLEVISYDTILRPKNSYKKFEESHKIVINYDDIDFLKRYINKNGIMEVTICANKKDTIKIINCINKLNRNMNCDIKIKANILPVNISFIEDLKKIKELEERNKINNEEIKKLSESSCIKYNT